MVDPMSLAAVTAMLGAVGTGMANEAGKRALESVGGLARRIAGREVAAPATPGDWDGLARLLHEGALRDPGHAARLAEVQALVRDALPEVRARAVPQLPPSLRYFTDRDSQKRSMGRELGRQYAGRPRRVLVFGPEGMGTSALARQWGWQATAAGHFPDGQVYVDLGGDGAEGGLDPAVAVRHVLRELGLTEPEIPPGRAECVALFRRLVAGLRLLLVLDHAHSAAQVGPLFTAAPGVFTIIVAHHRLAGLDAVPIEVDPLRKKDAVALLTDLVGERALKAASRSALSSVLARCGGSPYALRAMAPRLTGRQETPRHHEHHEEPGMPEREAGDGPAVDPVRDRGGHPEDPAAASEPVPPVVEDLYQELTPAPARLYRLAAVWPWAAFGAGQAAAAADVEEAEAGRLLEVLADQGLLERTDAGRYRYRPAVRRHAEQAALREAGGAAYAQAVRRTVEWALRFAVRADLAALPQRWHVGPLYADGRLTPGPYTGPGEAVAALGGELGNLVQAVLAAEEFGLGDVACQLCEALWAYQLKAGRHEELLPALRVGARVADAVSPGSRMAARMHTQLALAFVELRRFEEAETELTAAADAERAQGHLRGRATAAETLGLVRLAQWRYEEALELFAEADGYVAEIGPGEEGRTDVPRAWALLQRHRGRALRGLGRWAEAEELLTRALGFFRDSGEAYNAARTLTDLAETYHLAGRAADALPLIDEAVAALADERAEYHLGHLRALRERCTSGA
ncbi:tetratricopeptide repeat protein [Streptomyces sp. NPDC000151]|uniref:tetratricopeptide repeat protein n=1 Tax=Streptomyces sp. NPDC000151 TaxID=3154244 RepID=UPI003328F590